MSPNDTIHPVCAIFDKKTGLYEKSFTIPHVAEAVRDWHAVKQKPETRYGAHPEDFDLVEIGTYNLSRGTYENIKHRTLAAGV